MIQKDKYTFSHFQELVNLLIFNSGFFDNLGLMHGKMGQCIFFSLLFEKTKDTLFKNIYSRLINEIYNNIADTSESNFENGLAGIGWGIEYLVQKRLLNGDTDVILEDIDQRLSDIIKHIVPERDMLTSYCGYGFYLLQRLGNKNPKRNKAVVVNLKKMLDAIVNNVQTILEDNKIMFHEPREFDLFWTPYVLLMFQLELRKYSSLKKRSDSLKKNLVSVLNKTVPKTNKNRLLLNILLQVITNKRAISYNSIINEIALSFRKGRHRITTLRNSFLGVYILLNRIENILNEQLINEIADKLLVKFLNNYDPQVALQDTRNYGLSEGICGIALMYLQKEGFNINRTVQHNQPLVIHPKSETNSTKVCFVPYQHSGAGTYCDELLIYLKSCSSIELYVIEVSPEINCYTISRTDKCVNIIFPILSQYHDKKRFQNFNDKMADNYFSRVSELLTRDFDIPVRSIFHFNHPSDFKLLINKIKTKLKAITILTWHFVLEPFAKREFLSITESSEAKHLSGKILRFEKPEMFDAIVCVSFFAQQVLIKYYKIKKEKTRVIWNGSSYWIHKVLSRNEKKILRNELGFNQTKRLILYSGRLEMRKGIEELIEVAGELCQKYKDIHFVLVGNGNFEQYLPMCCGFFDKVTFTGNLSREHLQKLYHIADLGIVPSRWELFGYVPIEMMHSGLPVITTHVPGMSEITGQFTDIDDMIKVKHISNELIVDKSSLYSAIVKFIEDPARLKKHASKGFHCAQRYFSREIMGKKTITYYKELLQR